MKPVNLLPGDAPVVVANAGKPNLGMLGGAAVAFIAIIGIAAYFAMARVDSVKSETTAAESAAAAATAETTAVQSQVASLGQPTEDSDRQLAQGAEQVLVAAYSERHDFVRLAQELRGIMGSNGWYTEMEASSAGGGTDAGGGSGQAIKLVGYMPTKELAASLDERADSQSTMKNAQIVGLKQEKLVNLKTKKGGLYWRFTLKADLVDTVSPTSGSSVDTGASTSDGTGTTVGTGADGGSPTLSLAPRPPKKATAAATAAKPAPAAPAKPKNPFDVAATVAGRGGAS